MRRAVIALAHLAFGVVLPASASASTCFGTPGNGRIEHAVALSDKGANFVPYCELGIFLGRTYMHATVRDIVEDAYAALKHEQPGVTFVYGETGLRNGGPMPPHRTHNNGTSVDFMVPVARRKADRAARLPAESLRI